MVARLTEEFMQALRWFEKTGELGPLMALFHEEGEALNLGRSEPVRGRDAVMGFWQDHRSMCRGLHSEFTHVIEGGGGVVLEWISRGTLPSGEPLEYKGVTVLETEGGQIRRCRTYYDSAVFLPGEAREG